MRLGTIAALTGGSALAAVIAVGLSHSGDDGVTGPLTRILSGLLLDTSGPRVSEAKTSGLFDIYESNLRFLLQIFAVTAAVLSGVLSNFAAKIETHSLWYSVAVITSATALSELSYIGAGAFLFVFSALVLRARSWKMTHA